MADLFQDKGTAPDAIPLAQRLRPQSVDEFVGQKHLVGPEGPIRQMIAHKQVRSMILWGPPGSGKTTLAYLIGKASGRPFVALSAAEHSVKDLRKVLQLPPPVVLFLDEIHRFSRSQQDALLKPIEEGKLILIGATTENPSFALVHPLLSRCQIYRLHPLSEADLERILERALDLLHQEGKPLRLTPEAQQWLIRFAEGDARRLLNALETLAVAKLSHELTPEAIAKVLQEKRPYYDPAGDARYDLISALIKSIRGSDPDAAIYYLTQMMEAGEDPMYIARRLVIAAAEDVGLADPNALSIATAGMQAVAQIGYPEAAIILAEVTVYLALAPKSNTAHQAWKNARQFIQQHGALPPPLHLRNPVTRLMRQMGYGKGYQYPHDYPHHWVSQTYLPEAIQHVRFYHPGDNAFEQQRQQYWQQIKSQTHERDDRSSESRGE